LPCSRVQGQLSTLNFASEPDILEGVLPLVENTPSIINPLTEHTSDTSNVFPVNGRKTTHLEPTFYLISLI
jgi:hypothetical protein